jgi:hypothetical protein
MKRNVLVATVGGLLFGAGILFACPTPEPKLSPTVLPVGQASQVSYVQWDNGDYDDDYNAHPSDTDTYVNASTPPQITVTISPTNGGVFNASSSSIQWSQPGIYTVIVSVTSSWKDTSKTPAQTYTTTGSNTYTVTVIKLATETLVSTPTDRSRTKVGVGEGVKVKLLPIALDPSSISWTISPTSGSGTLSATPNNPIIFTAHERASAPTITATYAGCSCSVTFNVVEPDSVIIEQQPNTGIWHVHGIPSVGFKGITYLHPSDVSFEYIEVREGDVPAICTGYFSYQTGLLHTANSSWQSVGAVVAGKGPKIDAIDTISGGSDNHTPYVDGTFTWNIPREFRVLDSNASKQFVIVPQVKAIDNTGKLSISKGGATVAKGLNDPSSSY